MHLLAMFTFSLSKIYKKIGLLWDLQRYILLWWWTWFDCADCELSLSLKHLCLKFSRFVIKYEASFFSSKSSKHKSKRCIFCLQNINQILLVVNPDLTVLQCHYDILAVIDSLDVHLNHSTDFRWHLNSEIFLSFQVITLHYVIHSCNQNWAV